MTLLVILPYPPSVNHTYGKSRRGVYLLPKVLAFRKEAALRLSGARRFNDLPLAMKIWLHPPDKRRRDLDNGLKCILDIFQICQIYEDDSQIQRLFIEKQEISKPGYVSVYIEPYET